MDEDFAIRRAEASGAFVAETIGYRFHLLDRNDQEILAYHWHPSGVSPVTYPHLHLSGRLSPIVVDPGDVAIALGALHLPSGFVALKDIVRLLIDELRIEPQRNDWRAIVNGGPASGR